MKKSKSKEICGDFCGATSLGERGQFVVPKKLRQKLGMNKGDNFLVMEKHGMIILAPTAIMEDMVSNITKHLKNLK